MAGDLNVFLAVAAGVLSFLSPCVLPLIPSYISFIGGVSLQDLQGEDPRRAPVVVRTLAFVLGFSIVFIVLGIVFSGSGSLLGGATRLINYIAGAVVILLGLNVIFDFWKVLNFERRMHVSSAPRGYIGSALVGMAFGAGWTPCIGPILAGILFMAGQTGQVARGALLLGAFSLGLGIPFLLASVFFPAFLRWLQRIKRHLNTIRIASGVFLVGIGVLIAMGRLQTLNGTLISAGTSLGRWADADPGSARLVLGLSALALALIPPVWGLLRRIGRRAAGSPALIGRTGAVFTGLFVLIAALQLAGLLDMAEALEQWLTFQGI
ncbi:MAG: cytochrome c biogenesis CcdA family protein [Spirochaetaceae bacterium]